ncbi:MAG: GNAT family N-acetyltransferase [Erysipelotrichaceae bacterium]
MDNKLTFMKGKESDIELILSYIIKLAEYEKLANEVVATSTSLKEWLFDKEKAEVMFALLDGQPIGMALFYHSFSTFLGRSGIYLEDLFVDVEYRGLGYGKQILKELARITLERGCGRLEWVCINWNQSSIDFYEAQGAVALNEWTTFRMDEEALKKFQ